MTIEEVREKVFLKRPLFGEVVRTWGEKTCVEYCTQAFPGLCEPTAAVLDAIERETAHVLGPVVGRMAKESVREQKWVSTADHHGLLNHPYFYTAALARSHVSARARAGATVVLAFGNVSLSNDSFPRGFFFHDADFSVRRFVFKSLKERRLPVSGLAPMTPSEFEKSGERIAQVPLSKSARSRLAHMLDAQRSSPAVWAASTYSEQLTAMNQVLWHSLFDDSRGELVYLEIESVVRRLLLEVHLDTDTLIHQLLLIAEWREMFVRLFAEVPGSHGALYGTHFFWYVDRERHTRRALMLDGDVLTTVEGDVRISLTSQALRDALEARSILPSTALSLLIVHADGKLACAGGLSQIEYLKAMTERWSELLQHFGRATLMPYPSIFSGDCTLFSLKENGGMRTDMASAVDLLLYAQGDLSDTVDYALARASLGATVDVLLPTLHGFLSREKVTIVNLSAPAIIEHVV